MTHADLGTSTLDMEVLSMDVDTLHPDVEESLYRLRVGSQVKYITIEPGTFPSDVLPFPMDLLPLLPHLPPGNWVEARVAQYASRPVVSKIARFDFEIPRMERETAAYRAIKGCGVCPEFLGHIVEGDRVIGFLIEQLHGRPAGPEDLQGCRNVLQRLHGLNIIHGDPNKYNFVVASDGTVTLIDFENAMLCRSAEQKDEELATLPAQLSETTGRGGVVLTHLAY
ncbi:uncharacterized protein F5891DRAFT_1054107 [Suillus fuscotomentosus]|uniref:Alpha-galactosidase A n=1 Tax=Suillus fuscotomentosus TaxID=1912939 RepID=A0AAD4DYJ6_9AGAM|nr:uncharacterized protein F5891DRAFT_1054107 [Suillus fuscotomentosus]KAG1896481.1 hypothetical protein F5891DRAFT_1054107 [Suillus fuscotomentosus]